MPSYGYAIIWGVILLLSVITEASTLSLVAIWFMPGTLIAAILAMLDVSLIVQIIVFTVVTAACLVLTRPLCKRLKAKEFKTNVEAVIGKEVIITEDVDNLLGTGAAKLNGQEWTARSVEKDGKITAGTVAVVEEISGVKLICRAIKK